MRFLADECCDWAVVELLRSLGHDVLSVLETQAGAEDDRVLALAVAEQRVLLTEDKDFGQLVFSGLARSPGVIFMRFGHAARSLLLATLRDLFEQNVHRIEGSFVVVEPCRIRISPRSPATPRE